MPKLKIAFLILLSLSGFTKSIACGNDYYMNELPLYNSKLNIHSILHGEYGSGYWRNGFDFEGLISKRYEFADKVKKSGVIIKDKTQVSWKEIEQLLNKNIDFKLLSDFAWAELRIGDKKNAVKLLEALYAKHPDEYNILANLGTAYEVTGENQKALSLLKKAVAINPQSHYGSEWIHINILEQKVKAKPDYRSILNLKADENPDGWMKGEVYNKEIKPDSLMVQLAYQLHERISFVDAPEPIVGQLVKDFADLVSFTHSKKDAKDFYTYALHYDSTVLKSKPAAVEEENNIPANITKKEEEKKKPSNTLYTAVAAIGLITIIVIIILRKNKPSV